MVILTILGYGLSIVSGLMSIFSLLMMTVALTKQGRSWIEAAAMLVCALISGLVCIGMWNEL